MRIELINTGSELMLGRVLNTHQQWICRQLADRGYVVGRQVAIPDEGAAIQKAVAEAMERADLILVTGGLGPTSDDITRDLVAQLLGTTLEEDPSIVAHIEKFFLSRGRPMPASTRIQAMVPRGAQVLHNAHGTAPGLAFPIARYSGEAGSPARWLILLPGPPRELRPMLLAHVIPLVREQYPLQQPFICRTLRTAGLGESLAEERIAGPLKRFIDAGLELGYCARTGEVDIRLVSSAPGGAELVAAAEAVCAPLLEPYVFGADEDTLEGVVVKLLAGRGETVGVAESCTGGFLGNRITNVPGSSAVFRGGVIAYHNDIKQCVLDVPSSLLAEHGAVSEPVARAMAEGARRVLGVDWAVSLTGVAGPGGGTETKPVGTVFVGIASATGSEAAHHFNPFDRETFKWVSSQQALNRLRRLLLQASSRT